MRLHVREELIEVHFIIIIFFYIYVYIAILHGVIFSWNRDFFFLYIGIGLCVDFVFFSIYPRHSHRFDELHIAKNSLTFLRPYASFPCRSLIFCNKFHFYTIEEFLFVHRRRKAEENFIMILLQHHLHASTISFCTTSL